jgi:uncharacterized membrane protein YbaN (DUF454 family)
MPAGSYIVLAACSESRLTRFRHNVLNSKFLSGVSWDWYLNEARPWDTRKKADYSTLSVSTVIFRDSPQLRTRGISTVIGFLLRLTDSDSLPAKLTSQEWSELEPMIRGNLG